MMPQRRQVIDDRGIHRLVLAAARQRAREIDLHEASLGWGLPIAHLTRPCYYPHTGDEEQAMPEDSTKFLREEVKRLTDENRDLRDAMRAQTESVRAIAMLYHESQKISVDTDILHLLSHILDVSLAVLKASDGSLLLQDDATGELAFAVVRGKVADRLT